MITDGAALPCHVIQSSLSNAMCDLEMEYYCNTRLNESELHSIIHSHRNSVEWIFRRMRNTAKAESRRLNNYTECVGHFDKPFSVSYTNRAHCAAETDTSAVGVCACACAMVHSLHGISVRCRLCVRALCVVVNVSNGACAGINIWPAERA